MWNRITNLFKNILFWIIFVFVLYYTIAIIVFSLRHPWTTQMEQLIHIVDVLKFNKVTYKEMRGDYEK